MVINLCAKLVHRSPVHVEKRGTNCVHKQ